MSTRSTIAMKTNGENYLQIYCHWDGYIEGGVGEMLINHYNTYEEVEDLIMMGDASSINETLEESEFYHRDRNEDLQVEYYKDLTSFKSERMNEEYDYLFQDEEWYIIKDDFNLVKVKDVVLK
mgnify:CR=1 FL=1